MKQIIMKSILTALSLAAVTIFSNTATAATDWKKEVQPFNKGSHSIIKPMRLRYRLSWKGTITAGNLVFEFNKKDKRYPGYLITQTSGRSTGAAYAVFPYVVTMTSFINGKTLKPTLFLANELDKREKVITKNKFTRSGVIHTSTTTPLRSKKSVTKTHTFKFGNVHDPLSAIQYIRRQKLNNGDKIKIALHPFDSPMYGVITVLGREMHAGKKCIKLDVKLHKINRFTMKLQPYKKLKKATLWLSDDNDRLMMELRSKVFIGDIRMVLQKVENL